MILASKIGKHTRQGLKRKYEQMERFYDDNNFNGSDFVYGGYLGR